MTGTVHRQLVGPRIARGLPRPCEACSRPFRPANSKARYCSEACWAARRRLKGKTSLTSVPDSEVARVGFRSKSTNDINSLQSQNGNPRVEAKTGWQIKASELVFYPMLGAPSFTDAERRLFSRQHMRVE
jgi:hypothetical protein